MTKALKDLAGLLDSMERFSLRPADTKALDRTIKQLNGRTPSEPATDHLEAAVERFWRSGTLANYRDVRLTSYGLLHPVQAQGPCLLTSSKHMAALLEELARLKDKPSRLLRCYWGLLQSYLTFDPAENEQDAEEVKSWETLRTYLRETLRRLHRTSSEPAWIGLLRKHTNLFEEEPCSPYAQAVLDGDSSVVEELEQTLKIGATSWFRYELLWAQVAHAVDGPDEYFRGRIPVVMERIAGNSVYRNELFAMILDRYAEVPGTPLHPLLRDKAVAWWGNPWLPSNRPNWLWVSESTKRMVTTWLNTEFITAFFNKLVVDGSGDPRRAKFWLQYASIMSSVFFGLTPATIRSRDRDLMVLREKLEGLWMRFNSSGSNNAFIMFIGPLALVEFGDKGAVYGYDTRSGLPFDVNRPFEETKNIENSLKHDRRVVWKSHGSPNWEVELATELETGYGIRPAVPVQPSAVVANRSVTHRPRKKAASPSAKAVQAKSNHTSVSSRVPKHIRMALQDLGKRHVLLVEDLTERGGHLWVLGQKLDPSVEAVLKALGFAFREDKGWWFHHGA